MEKITGPSCTSTNMADILRNNEEEEVKYKKDLHNSLKSISNVKMDLEKTLLVDLNKTSCNITLYSANEHTLAFLFS